MELQGCDTRLSTCRRLQACAESHSGSPARNQLASGTAVPHLSADKSARVLLDRGALWPFAAAAFWQSYTDASHRMQAGHACRQKQGPSSSEDRWGHREQRLPHQHTSLSVLLDECARHTRCSVVHSSPIKTKSLSAKEVHFTVSLAIVFLF